MSTILPETVGGFARWYLGAAPGKHGLAETHCHPAANHQTCPLQLLPESWIFMANLGVSDNLRPFSLNSWLLKLGDPSYRVLPLLCQGGDQGTQIIMHHAAHQLKVPSKITTVFSASRARCACCAWPWPPVFASEIRAGTSQKMDLRNGDVENSGFSSD